MSWYVVDAIDRAIERTRKCLIEPFDLKKWLKLAIIVFFVGGTGSFNGGGNGGYGGSFGDMGSDISFAPSGLIDILGNLYDQLTSYPNWLLIASFVAFILVFILIMGFIGSIMEFVFVESLVRNDVRIREYFSSYIGKGISLFFLRIIMFILLILLVAIIVLPVTLLLISGDGEPGGLSMILVILSIIAAILVLVVAGGILGSFISMSVPVSMYPGSGLFSALQNVFLQFRNDWKQMLIYCIGRAILGIAAAIVVTILALIGIIVLGIVLLAIDIILYFGLDIILSDTAIWLVLIPILIAEFVIFLFSMAFISMPVTVFMKYHMLSFLEKWYPLDMPLFDVRSRTDDNITGELNY